MKNYHVYKNEERFNRVVSLLIIITLCFLIFYFVTYSWFGSSDEASRVITIGNISIVVNTDLDFSGVYLEPDKVYNKSTTITGSNTADGNTNDAFIKAKLESDLRINGENIILPIYDTNKWIYDGSEWYYYVGYINSTTTATFNSALQVTNLLTNNEKNQNIQLTLTIYSVQKDYQAYTADPDWTIAPQAWKDAVSAL